MLVTSIVSFIGFANIEFPEPPTPPGSSQYYKYEKAAVNSVEFNAARKAVTALFPNETAQVRIEPLQPGNSGMWPFKVTTSQQNYLLKIASPDARINVAAQAERARWAGAQGNGPVVCGEDRINNAYVTQFIEGPVLSHEQAAGEKRTRVAQALRKLHTSDASELTSATFKAGSENWLFYQDLSSCLNGSTDVRTRLFTDELVDFYLRSDKKLSEMEYTKTPVHDDIKSDNSFVVGDKIVFIDWDNLKLSDPMSDLAHFLWSIDAPVCSTGKFLNDYYAGDAAPQAEQEEALVRLQLRLFQVRLRSFAFFGQYEGNEENTRFYQYLLKDDIAAIKPLL